MKKSHQLGDSFSLAGSTGLEPAISSVTGRRDNHFTTSPYLVAVSKYRGNHTNFISLKQLVRVAGVEPASQPWEGYIIAVIRHPRNDDCLEPPPGFEPGTPALRKRCSSQLS